MVRLEVGSSEEEEVVVVAWVEGGGLAFGSPKDRLRAAGPVFAREACMETNENFHHQLSKNFKREFEEDSPSYQPFLELQWHALPRHLHLRKWPHLDCLDRNLSL